MTAHLFIKCLALSVMKMSSILSATLVNIGGLVPLAALALVFCAAGQARALTIQTIDMADSATLYTNSDGLLRGYGGKGEFLAANYNHRMALINFDISSLSLLSYDYVFLSLTEIRTSASAIGITGIYINDGSFPSEVLSGITVDPATQEAFDAGQTFVGNITPSGVGGNHLLFDVTSPIQHSLLKDMDLVGFLLRDDLDDGLSMGILGSNYNSGLPSCTEPVIPCQYYASSLYEYPTLITTIGSEITPFDELPLRPIIEDPLGPEPEPVPEPSTLLLLGSGLAGVAALRRKFSA